MIKGGGVGELSFRTAIEQIMDRTIGPEEVALVEIVWRKAVEWVEAKEEKKKKEEKEDAPSPAQS